MATIGTISVDMIANTSRFDRNLRRSRETIGLVQRSTRGLSSAFGLLSTAIAGIGFASVIKNALDFGDNIQKLSIRLGVSTEALSEFAFIAERSGVSFQTFTTGLQRQTRRISEAALGIGETGKALDELGLSAIALNDLKADEQFRILASAIDKVENSADKVRLAFKLWDAEGVKLLQIADGGAAALEGLSKQFDEVGFALTRADADKLASVNDAITNLSTSFSSLGTSLTLELADTIIFINEAILDLSTALRDSVGAILPTQIALVKIDIIYNRLASSITQLLVLRSEVENFLFDNASTRSSVANFKNIANEFALAAVMASQKLTALETQANRTSQKVTLPGSTITANAAPVSASSPAITGELDAVINSLQTQEEMIQNSFVRRQQIILENTQAGSDQQTELVLRLANERDSKLKEISDREDARDASQRRNRIQQTGQMFANLATLSDSSNKKLSQIGKTAAIADATVRTYQAATGAYAALAAIPIVGPALGAAAATAAILAGLANVAKMKSAGAFEHGGFIPSGSFGLVGEAGPEFVKGPATITSAADTRRVLSQSSGSTTNITQNLNISVASQNGNVQPESIDQIQAQVFRALQSAAMRN